MGQENQENNHTHRFGAMYAQIDQSSQADSLLVYVHRCEICGYIEILGYVSQQPGHQKIPTNTKNKKESINPRTFKNNSARSLKDGFVVSKSRLRKNSKRWLQNNTVYSKRRLRVLGVLALFCILILCGAFLVLAGVYLSKLSKETPQSVDGHLQENLVNFESDNPGTDSNPCESSNPGTGSYQSEPDNAGSGSFQSEPDSVGSGFLQCEPDNAGTGSSQSEPDNAGSGSLLSSADNYGLYTRSVNDGLFIKTPLSSLSSAQSDNDQLDVETSQVDDIESPLMENEQTEETIEFAATTSDTADTSDASNGINSYASGAMASPDVPESTTSPAISESTTYSPTFETMMSGADGSEAATTTATSEILDESQFGTIIDETNQTSSALSYARLIGKILDGSDLLEIIQSNVPVEIITDAGKKLAANCTIKGATQLSDFSQIGADDQFSINLIDIDGLYVIVANQISLY